MIYPLLGAPELPGGAGGKGGGRGGDRGSSSLLPPLVQETCCSLFYVLHFYPFTLKSPWLFKKRIKRYNVDEF